MSAADLAAVVVVLVAVAAIVVLALAVASLVRTLRDGFPGVALTWITLGPAGAQRIAHGAAKDIAPERRP